MAAETLTGLPSTRRLTFCVLSTSLETVSVGSWATVAHPLTMRAANVMASHLVPSGFILMPSSKAFLP